MTISTLFRSSLVTLALAGAVTTGSATAADYIIDTEGAHASINFRVNHLGFSWLTGRFNDFTGQFNYDPNNPEASQINVTIDTASIDSAHQERDEHLRSADFLHVEEHPEARFISTSYEATGGNTAIMEGDFTLNGVTRPITLTVEKIGQGTDPWGNERVGFSAVADFQLKDYGIDYELGPDSETVYLTLEVEGIRQ